MNMTGHSKCALSHETTNSSLEINTLNYNPLFVIPEIIICRVLYMQLYPKLTVCKNIDCFSSVS